jgi:hypothetical protein
LRSSGPDRYFELYRKDPSRFLNLYWFPWTHVPDTEASRIELLQKIYDPTNGTVSFGDLFRAGGNPPPGPLGKMWWDIVNR